MFEVVCKKDVETKRDYIYEGTIYTVFSVNDCLFLIYTGNCWEWVNSANFKPVLSNHL